MKTVPLPEDKLKIADGKAPLQEDKENITDATAPEPQDGLLEKLKNTLFSSYEPVAVYREGTIFMSTREIWTMLQRIYPNEVLYSPAEVAQWLHEKGFTFYDNGQMRYEWMLKPVS